MHADSAQVELAGASHPPSHGVHLLPRFLLVRHLWYVQIGFGVRTLAICRSAGLASFNAAGLPHLRAVLLAGSQTWYADGARLVAQRESFRQMSEVQLLHIEDTAFRRDVSSVGTNVTLVRS